MASKTSLALVAALAGALLTVALPVPPLGEELGSLASSGAHHHGHSGLSSPSEASAPKTTGKTTQWLASKTQEEREAYLSRRNQLRRVRLAEMKENDRAGYQTFRARAREAAIRYRNKRNELLAVLEEAQKPVEQAKPRGASTSMASGDPAIGAPARVKPDWKLRVGPRNLKTPEGRAWAAVHTPKRLEAWRERRRFTQSAVRQRQNARVQHARALVAQREGQGPSNPVGDVVRSSQEPGAATPKLTPSETRDTDATSWSAKPAMRPRAEHAPLKKQTAPIGPSAYVSPVAQPPKTHRLELPDLNGPPSPPRAPHSPPSVHLPDLNTAVPWN